jgi:uncharacterized protein (TIGR02246 family)
LTILMACAVAVAWGSSDPQVPAGEEAPAKNTSDQSSPEYQAIADLARKYEAAYEKGDPKEFASFYTEDVDYIDQDGAEVKGRDALLKLLADNLQANPGAKLAITVDEVKQLSPDVLVDRGIATVTPSDEGSRARLRVGSG